MATISLDAQALADADAFLTAYLSENVPDADFSKGSVVRDFVITAIAYVFAYLEQERKTTRAQQSLVSLSTLQDDQSVQDAVNALLSNWFITRKTGQTARLTATLHFSTATDVTITPTTRFYRTVDLIYVPDAVAVYVIPAASLTPVYDANNVVTEYTTTINLVAMDVGANYNIPAGKFLKADMFNPFFVFAENQSSVQGGVDTESTAALLARAPTAITVRNLVNVRSITTVLLDTFPGLTRVLPLGFGEPEMLRDYTSEAVTNLRMHVGGHTDIYVQLPVNEVSETGVLGTPFTRPDGITAVLRDGSANFLAGPAVAPGDVLHIASGLTDAPRDYIINAVTATTLTVSPRAAFIEATDTFTPPGYVTYSIGNYSPSFSDKRTLVTTGQTSQVIQTPNRITLQGQPHYRIKRLEITNAASPSVVTILTTRVNPISASPVSPASMEYAVEGLTPENGQSALAVDQIVLNPTDYATGTWNIKVIYDTLVGYANIQAFVRDQFERVLDSNPLVRGYTPVYISLGIAYRLKIGATAQVDEAAVSTAVAGFINTFDLTKTLDLTGITQFIRDQFPNIGAVVNPVVLTYNLYAPDGQVYEFRSQDIITVYPSYPHNNANLTNGAQLRTPIPNADLDPTISINEPLFYAANQALNAQLVELGVSDRTLVFLTTANDIVLTQVV